VGYVKIGGLPPGTKITYQWLLTDAVGNKLKTPSAEISFDDNRYTWKTLTDGLVTFYWYSGTQSFAQELMQATQSALTRLSASTGAYIQDPVRLYIYENSTDLQGAMLFSQDWAGGVTFGSYGCIAIGISAANIDWEKGYCT